jgi:hypothetical protein
VAARPVFVIGAARSGTNLVRALLSAHPSIELRNEPELILSLTRAGVGPDDVVPREDRVGLLFEFNRSGLTRQHVAALPPARIEKFLTADQDLGLKEIYELLLPRPDGDVVWGEKSLGNSYLMREIAALYPDAGFVHVLRDPRATTSSYAELHFLEDEGEELELTWEAVGFVAYSAMRWASTTDAIDRSSEILPDGSLTRVPFEELVEDPATVLRRVCAFFGVEFDPRMVEPEHRRRDPVLESRRVAHHRLSEPVDPARARAGDQLPAWAAAVVERYAGEGMAKHGYPSRGDDLASGEQEKLVRELDFLEPILRERLERELSRRGPPIRRGTVRKPHVTDQRSMRRIDSLGVLAATAKRRRGVGSDSKTEVEALRAFAAAAIEELEEARESNARTRRRLRAANAKIRDLRSQPKEGPKVARKRRKKSERRASRSSSEPTG